jgi:hypothetical protein
VMDDLFPEPSIEISSLSLLWPLGLCLCRGSMGQFKAD